MLHLKHFEDDWDCSQEEKEIYEFPECYECKYWDSYYKECEHGGCIYDQTSKRFIKSLI